MISALVSVLGATDSLAVTYGEPVIDASKFSEVVIVQILNTDTGEFINACTGTLISQTEVLTAAHCVRGYDTFQVVVGAIETGQGTTIGVRDTWYSSRYSKAKFANDIGLLLLSSPANTPVVGQLSPISFSPSKKTTYTLVGFGDDQNGDQGPLRAATLKVQTKAASRYFKKVFNSKTTLAAGRYLRSEKVYSGACDGDSGGPLFSKIKGKRYIVGITSYGAMSCEASRPSIFAKVGYYRKEITKGRNVLASTAATPVQPLAFSLDSASSFYYNSFTVTASTDSSASLVAICVTIKGVPATRYEVTGDGSILGYSPSSGCFSVSGSSITAGRLDFDTDVALAQVKVSIRDSFGQTATKDFAIDAAATALSISLTPTSGYSWEKRYTVAVPNSLFISPLKLCVTVDGRAATSSEVEGDIYNIPYLPTDGCFTSSSSYPINGGYINFDNTALIGTHQIVVTITDVLNRSQSTSFSITGCEYPYSC
jgi:hypothetical protein